MSRALSKTPGAAHLSFTGASQRPARWRLARSASGLEIGRRIERLGAIANRLVMVAAAMLRMLLVVLVMFAAVVVDRCGRRLRKGGSGRDKGKTGDEHALHGGIDSVSKLRIDGPDGRLPHNARMMRTLTTAREPDNPLQRRANIMQTPRKSRMSQ
ncbi:hypothetical protein [Paraburkholderia sp. J63]|uniref:hypothetical protein n=1 Tax=Paraburkholderia sp. J63 TaxID=2805434 RepID=UPI002ABE1191|nr:hypothetical protein [Paraburkholderia sp. J63]